MTPPLIGREVRRLGTVESTMRIADRLAKLGAVEGTVVVAEAQTAGVGRHGRAWQAPSGSAVLCSVILRPAVAAARRSTLPLVFGVATAEAIERSTALRTSLKWPNDILLGGHRKVAGILLNAGADAAAPVILGVGINVSSAATELPPGATSLAAETGRLFSPDDVLHALLDHLDAWYRCFLKADGRPPLHGWRSRAALLNEEVIIAEGKITTNGILRGIDDDGALLIEQHDGSWRRMVAGTVTLGPRRSAG